MVTLKDPQKQIPGGYRYYEPNTKWQPAAFSSLDTIAAGLLRLRQANPHLTKRFGWSLDPNVVLQEVMAYNAQVCKAMGWKDYLISDEAIAPPPKSSPPAAPRWRDAVAGVRAITAGIGLITDWIRDGAPAVPQELAEARAAVCVACPLHGRGDFSRWFTVPAQAAIRRQLDWIKGRDLHTSKDELLNICTACACPMRLKVHIKTARIGAHTSVETRAKLAPGCWILKETNGQAA